MFGKYHIAGIDLGTCNSTISIFNNGVISLVQDPYGNRSIPSMVSFLDDTILYGMDAKNRQYLNPERTIYGIKRILGHQFSSNVVQREIERFQFKVIPGVRDLPLIPVNYRGAMQILRPEGISSRLIGYLVNLAEKALEDSIVDIVITCPAYFDDNQRQATKDAVTIAGYNVLEVLNEPTAAAIAYGINVKKENKPFLVYDLGGGTFDATLMIFEEGAYRVMGTTGDTNLGGMDFDTMIKDIILKKFELQGYQVDMSKKKHVAALWQTAERSKIELSCSDRSTIFEDSIGSNPEIELYRAEFEELARPLIESTIEKVCVMLEYVQVPISDLCEIVLIGGSSLIPLISTMLEARFRIKPSQRINGQEAVAIGALMRALELKCRTDFPETIEDLEKELHNISPIVPVINAIPLPIGIRTSRDELSIVLPKYTRYGATHQVMYQTSDDNQQRFIFEVYQGENAIATENCFIGKLIIEGIEPAPKGTKKIQLTMSLDQNGILTMSVVNPENRETKRVEFLKQSTNLSQEEIEAMQRQVRQENEFNRLQEQRESAKNFVMRISQTINQLILDNRFPTDLMEEAQSFVGQVEGLTPQSDNVFSLEATAKEWNSRLLNMH